MKLKFQTKLDHSGRVIIPDEILRELQISGGTVFNVEKAGGKIMLEPDVPQSNLIEREELLILHAELTDDITEALQKSREDRISNVLKESLE